MRTIDITGMHLVVTEGT